MQKFEAWLGRVRQIVTLTNVTEFLEFDAHTMLPKGGHVMRAKQQGVLKGLRHTLLTDSRFGEETAELLGSDGLDAKQRACVTAIHRDIRRALCVPSDLVRAIEEAVGAAGEVWPDARKNDDFAVFAPKLERVIALKREEADAYGAPDRYDGLLDEFEPGGKAADLQRVFEALAQRVRPLLDMVRGAAQPDTTILGLPYTEDETIAFARGVIHRMGFDFNRGRLDRTAHAMCVGSSMDDVRICTFDPFRGFRQTVLALIHEAGHGLYEQGYDPEWWGTPLAQSISYGVHESQSGFWELWVAASAAFWDFYFPHLQERFPFLSEYSAEQMYRAMNLVKPDFIRIEADTLTYDLHVLLRLRLERALIGGTLAVKDLPDAWNAGMEELLGIKPPTNREGCLQDVHWSVGYFGYFPTYTLGHLISAQLWEAFERKSDRSPAGLVRHGLFSEFRDWLRKRVHRRGRSCTSDELVREVTGKPLSADAFVDLVTRRYEEVYRL